MLGEIFAHLGLRHNNGPFIEQFKCFSLTFHNKADKENGDKIILPSSAFEKLAGMQVQYPMQFEISNENVFPPRKTHVGVLEFTAPEGQMFAPFWIMQNLLLEENQFLTIRNVSLQLATFVKFRPQSCDFLDISNPKVVLETALRNFSCLTKDDQICLPYSGKNYFLEVVEIKPDNAYGAVSIVEADVNVDFEAPVGYVEPQRSSPALPPLTPPSITPPPPLSSSSGGDSMKALADARESRRKELEVQKASYVPFSGTGRRIDDKTMTAVTVEAAPLATASSRTNGKWKQKTQATAFHGQARSLS